MHFHALFLTAVFVALSIPTPAGAQAIERPFDRTLSVSGPVSLSVSSGSGSIKVQPGSDGSVRVTGIVRGTSWWRGASDAEVRKAVETVVANPPIVQNGNSIEIGEIADRELAQRVAISYEITVPNATALRSRTGSGSQQVGALGGPVTVSTGSGSVEVARVGAAVEVSTGSGSVKVAGAREHARVSTGSGTVHLGTVDGNVEVRTGSGSIHVDEAAGGSVRLNTGSGSIDVGRLDGGLTAHSSSGSIEIGGTPEGSWDLQTSSGAITLAIPDGTPFELQARTSSGSISTEHNLSVQTVGRRELSGTAGGGGARISARSNSGRINIEKR